MRIIKDGSGDVLTHVEDILERWRGYFENLKNKEKEKGRAHQCAMCDVHAQGV